MALTMAANPDPIILLLVILVIEVKALAKRILCTPVKYKLKGGISKWVFHLQHNGSDELQREPRRNDLVDPEALLRLF